MIDFAKRTIVVLGQKIEVDTNDGLPIVDISNDLDSVAAQMAWWASVWAAAERQELATDGEYRQWKSRAMLAALAKAPKDSEWKIKAVVEGSDGFLKFQSNKALARDAAVLSKAMFDSYAKKANALQSRGASEREQIERQGMTTPVSPKRRPSVAPKTRPVGGDPDEPPIFTAADDESDDIIPSAPPAPRPSTEDMVAQIKKRNLEKKKDKK
jgi:hypothetical protein